MHARVTPTETLALKPPEAPAASEADVVQP